MLWSLLAHSCWEVSPAQSTHLQPWLLSDTSLAQGLEAQGHYRVRLQEGIKVCLTFLVCPVLPSTATNLQSGSGLKQQSEAAPYNPQEVQDSLPLQALIVLSSVPHGAFVAAYL